MKRLIVAALCAVAFGACGDDGGDGPNLNGNGNGGTADAAPPVTACNPVNQTGCNAGEKCANVTVQVEPMLLSKTECVPDGSVAPGGECTTNEPGDDGYDNCVAGYECLGGVCTEICSVAPDSCGDGSACTLFNGLFDDNTGLCTPTCDPTAQTITDGVVVNPDCGPGNGCYHNSSRGVSGCASVADDKGQNQPCDDGTPAARCFLNGCASGFGPLLNNAVGQEADGSNCARVCSPRNTYLDENDAVAGAPQGANNHCDLGELTTLGGTAGNNSEHQCRFLQSFYGESEQNPESVGMCVPEQASNGTWGNCKLFIWDDIIAAWNAAAPNGADAANAAFDGLCVEGEGKAAEIKPECLGYFRGCLSLAEESERLMDPAGTGTFFSAGDFGRFLYERNPAARRSIQEFQAMIAK